MKDAKKPDQLNEVCERNIGSDIAKIRELLSSPRLPGEDLRSFDFRRNCIDRASLMASRFFVESHKTGQKDDHFEVFLATHYNFKGFKYLNWLFSSSYGFKACVHQLQSFLGNFFNWFLAWKFLIWLWIVIKYISYVN